MPPAGSHRQLAAIHSLNCLSQPLLQVGAAPGATFAATRAAIRRWPLSFYRETRDWLLRTDIESKSLGMVRRGPGGEQGVEAAPQERPGTGAAAVAHLLVKPKPPLPPVIQVMEYTWQMLFTYDNKPVYMAPQEVRCRFCSGSTLPPQGAMPARH